MSGMQWMVMRLRVLRQQVERSIQLFSSEVPIYFVVGIGFGIAVLAHYLLRGIFAARAFRRRFGESRAFA
jgi:hypothetical protein